VKAGESSVGPDRFDVPSEISRGHDRDHAGGRSGRGGVNGRDPGVGEGTADEGNVQRLRQRDVGYKASTAHEQARVFPPPNGRSQVWAGTARHVAWTPSVA
jgi:hypothetical protein